MGFEWLTTLPRVVEPATTYAVFGMTVSSEIDLPELARTTRLPEVAIRRGPVVDSLDDAVAEGVLYQAAPGRLRLDVPNVATFLACHGREVTIAPYPGVDEQEIRLFLYGSVLGAILQQRGVLTIHASAVTDGEQAVLLSGRSGGGKSTLAATLVRRGFRLLSDDVVAIRHDRDRGALASAGYPELKLWADALHRLDIDPTGLKRVRAGLEKSYVPAHERFASEPLPVSHVYLLGSHNLDEITLEPMIGHDRVGTLVRNTYRRNYLDGLGGKERHFEACVELARQARIVRVARPAGGFRITELADRIEADVRGLPVA